MVLPTRIDHEEPGSGAAARARAVLGRRLLATREGLRARVARLRRTPLERLRRVPLRTRGGLLLVRHERRWQVARRDERLKARDVALSNLDVVEDALRTAAIPYFLVPAEDGNRTRVGVARCHRAAALTALASRGDPALLLSLDDRRVRRRRSVLPLGRRVTARTSRRALRAGVWWVYRNHADPAGHVVLGHAYACEVEFWSESGQDDPPAPELRAPRWNRHAEAVPRDAVGAASVPVGARMRPTVPQFAAAPHVDEVAFPVDLVYTWVDGSDPAWVERKNEVLRTLDLATVSADSTDASRYQSRDELKYSLRSVAMYADFARRIYIVTDDQVPPWLDTDHPRIRLVSHKEIFAGEGRLPTFNSHAIEARLHHIEGLAEHYLYLNDDFFFCRRLGPGHFFLSNGLSKFFGSSALIGVAEASARARSVDAAARNSRRLLAAQFSRTASQKVKHGPYPQRRSVLFEMEQVFADEFGRTWANQIRSPDDIPVPSSLYHYYAYLTGRAVPGTTRASYVALGHPDFAGRLRKVERRRIADTLCINDTPPAGHGHPEADERLLREFLDRNWPVKSEFER